MLENIVAICPTVERKDLVRQMVLSYRETCTPNEPPPLFVVATGRDDGTEGWCANQELHVISSPEVLPYSKAVNLGVAKALDAYPETEWLLLLNNDLILHPGFWDGLEDSAKHGYDIIGAKLLYPNDTIQHFGKWFSLDFQPFHVLRWQPKDNPETLMLRMFPDVTFACVAIHRGVWDGEKGLDESYTNGYEDDDFCLRARFNGAQIGVHPGMLATHLEAQTSGHDDANKAAMYQKFAKEWVETGRVQWALGMFQGWAHA